ncbi:M28 family metallopeptidase [Sodalis sp. C49]|uniref:M28 family metallopeptidase n=1 Tax=Sodalis sp. C49 TaxID=3228929 RepID=UPI003965ACAB
MPVTEPHAGTLLPLMDSLLRQFSQLHRLSGSDDAERSAGYLAEVLSRHGLSPRIEQCSLLLSNPLSGSLQLPDYPAWRCAAKTRSFSASCPLGVDAALFYDARSTDPIPDNQMAQWSAQVKGKIVIADQGFEDYVQRLDAAGALGLIHIWWSGETALHEETVGPIWGTPVPDDRHRYPRLPVISINQQQGRELLAFYQRHPAPLTARLRTELQVAVSTCSLPVVEIAGESPEFVLLSSHYDSWHEGVTDNATGNALCLAMAVHFHQHRHELTRGLRIAWWPGHSNARYGGSTWYADRFRHPLAQHCVAHINVDSPGCMEALQVVINASGAEQPDFLNRAVRRVTGSAAQRITPLGKGGDQSFWGSGLPLHFALREEPLNKNTLSPGSGGGWWWHTEADTYDKVDLDILWRDSRIHGYWLAELLTATALPLDPLGYRDRLYKEMAALQDQLDPAFDLSPALDAMVGLRDDLQRVVACWQYDTQAWQPAIIKVLALWHRLRYSSVDDFHYDLSYHGGAFPGLRILKDQAAQATPETFLMMTTQFHRQRDRALDLLERSAQVLRTALSRDRP